MAYKCCNCGNIFNEPNVYYERHGFSYGPGERIECCPDCGYDNFEEVDEYCEDEWTREEERYEDERNERRCSR